MNDKKIVIALVGVMQFAVLSTSPITSKDSYKTSWLYPHEHIQNRWNMYRNHKEKEDARLYVGDKPFWRQMGYYKQGRYVQFTFDATGFAAAVAAGGIFRLLYSVSTCGTKFETFKSAVVRPGGAKSFLFWMPAAFAYQYVAAHKEHVYMLEQNAQKEASKSQQEVTEQSFPKDYVEYRESTEKSSDQK